MRLLHVCYVVALVILTASLADADCDHCGANTVCILGECVCRENYIGNPYFYCYDREKYYCGIMNDPVLQTFGGEHVKLLSVGSTRFAQLQTQRLGSVGLRDACDLDISVFTGRHRGKVYIAGVQARVIRTFGNDNETAEVTIRIFGEVVNGVYIWTVEVIEDGQSTFVTVATITSDQPLGQARVDIDLGRGCKIRVYRDQWWFLRVEFTCCGVDFGIRPYSPVVHHRFPGIWLVVCRTQYLPFFPFWPWNAMPICLDAFRRVRIIDVVREIGIPDPPCAFSFLAFTNGGVVDFPGSTPALRQIGPTLSVCTIAQRISLYRWDKFIIIYVRFIRCVSPPGSGPFSPLPYFLDAARYLCGGEIDRCEGLKTSIRNQCGGLVARGDREIVPFLNQPCGP